jgi:hypothetical protein
MNFFGIKRSLAFIYCFFAIQATFAEIARDLDLNALFTTINLAQSNHGSDALRTILAQPTSDIVVLKNRQAAIALIAHDAQFHAQLHSLLKAFGKQEPHFERIMQPASDIEIAALEEFYFSSQRFQSWNYSPAYLELGYIAHCGNLCSSMAQHALAFAIFTWGLDEKHVCHSHPAEEDTTPKNKKHHSKKNGPKDDHKKEHGKKHTHKDGSPCEKSHDHNHDHKKEHDKNHKHDDLNHPAGTTCTHPAHLPPTGFTALAQSKEFKYAFQLWHSIAQIQELYGIQAIVRADMQCIKKLQIQLMGVARGIHLLNHIHTVLKNNPGFTTHLTHYQDLENICNKSDLSEKLNALLTLLETPTFKGKASVFSRIGIILAAYKLTQEVAHELQPALAAIGEIDAYASCAQLLKNHQSTPYQYSFAQYSTNNATPLLRAHNFWHPLISNDNIQLNSISLGTDQHVRNIVLTGPNACGKSTSLKALTICAYYAQTITLVPAETYSQTLYKEIYSSMVVSDNIQENKSLFVAELTDAENLLTRVENLASGEYMFIALDELFKSTHHEKGQNIAYRLLEHLYASPQIITVVSTHFEKLIELADKNSDRCANYTVKQFILEPGVGSPDNSFDIIDAQIKSRLLQ